MNPDPTTSKSLLWQPSAERMAEANITSYMKWLSDQRNLKFDDYQEVWEWSVTRVEDFWDSIWHYFHVKASSPYTQILSSHQMPGMHWFADSKLNYAEHIFRYISDDPAVISRSETRQPIEVTWQQLSREVAAMSSALKSRGVERGDRVAAYISNIPEAVVSILACASIGAIWSSCSPDFGAASVTDRFGQIDPKVLLAVDGYMYGGKSYDRIEIVHALQKSLPSLELTVLIPHLSDEIRSNLPNTVSWQTLLDAHENAELAFEQVPFEHPLWILYTSGTTGPPKAIVQGHGGVLLEHLKALSFHTDLKQNDRFFWFTTTGWMMWNFLVSGLLNGTSIVLYDGSPAYPDWTVLWNIAESTGITCFGTSAAYVSACMKAGVEPHETEDLSKMLSISSTGSPMSEDGFRWIYSHVKKDVWLSSVSGGTDLCTPVVGGCPLLPVREGEIQCRYLGAKVLAFDELGNSVLNAVGELVIAEPMPSMPLYFWNDIGNQKYRQSYFAMFPGVWRHGDWIEIDTHGHCVIYGRSDSTIKRHGVRIGTSEIYKIVEAMPEVSDSLVVDLEGLGGRPYMAIFVVLKVGSTLDQPLKSRILEKIRTDLSPRYIPDDVFAVDEVPKTLNGKKLEIPIRKVLLGFPLQESVNIESMANPSSIQFFVQLAKKLSPSRN